MNSRKALEERCCGTTNTGRRKCTMRSPTRIVRSSPPERSRRPLTPQTAPVPFHNNTCDGCHVRNGSGIPINTAGTLDVSGPLQEFMTTAAYNPGGEPGNSFGPRKDYTFTGQIRPMKLVFFDLKRVTSSIDDSVYSKPLTFSANQAPSASDPQRLYYNNKIMNFYGDSFHVTRPGYNISAMPGTMDRQIRIEWL